MEPYFDIVKKSTMKYFFSILTLSLFFFSCKPKTNNKDKSKPEEVSKVEESPYPKALQNVFEAHGTLKLWKQQRSLSYKMPKKEKSEIHHIDLWSRMDRIDMDDVSLGNDGKTWVLDIKNMYKGNPEFYHNLMFYFYAMPFVLADDGINYAQTEDLIFEGKNYPGIEITYDSGIGTSPKDEYYLHYDPDTYQMAWLGYTVTYRTGEDSDNVKWIRYNDWGNFQGLVLPKSISWYHYEGRQLGELRNTVVFEDITLSNVPKPETFYTKPEAAVYFVKGSK